MAETAVVENNTESLEGEDSSRIYEIGYHIVPTKKEDELDGVVGKIRSMIEKAEGKFIAEGAPTLQRLSYIISTKEKGKRMDHDRGYFGWIKFEAPTEAAQKLERALAEMPELLRSILFRTVREETRAKFKTASLREVRRGDILKAAPRVEETAAPISEEDIDKAIEDLTTE